jgi:hypothetical protein
MTRGSTKSPICNWYKQSFSGRYSRPEREAKHSCPSLQSWGMTKYLPPRHPYTLLERRLGRRFATVRMLLLLSPRLFWRQNKQSFGETNCPRADELPFLFIYHQQLTHQATQATGTFSLLQSLWFFFHSLLCHAAFVLSTVRCQKTAFDTW